MSKATKKKTSRSDFATKYLQNTKAPAYMLSEDMFPIKEYIDSGNYALNALLTADWENGGYPTGRVVQLAGPASVGKTFLFTEAIKQAQAKGYTVFFVDSEFGSDAKSWISRGVDPELFIHAPIRHIKSVAKEVLDFVSYLKPDDKAVVIIDSVGNLSSAKETADILSENDKADMTRPKELKGMFRQLPIPLGVAGVPLWIVNHEYASMSMYGGPVQGGGTGPGYGSSIILSMTKSKEKKSKDGPVIGTGVRCKAVKNRFAKEQSVVSVVIDFNTGLSRYSGLFQLALDTGWIVKPTAQTYSHKEGESHKKTFYANNPEFWEGFLREGFGEHLNNMFMYQAATESQSTDLEVEENTEPEQ